MKDLFGDKVERAIELLRMYQPKDRPYYGCFSGGKDSCVIKEIARIGNINVIWHYNVTTIDPPELCRFIKKFHPDVIWNKPAKPFFEAAKTNGYPTHQHRWCCKIYKESTAPIGSVMIFGIRAAESQRRAKTWKEVTAHTKTQQYVISPIVDWEDYEVWQFIKSRNLPYCSLYDEGFTRLGCMGCPRASNKKQQFQRWPYIERAWRRLFDFLYAKKERRGFSSGEEMFNGWILNNPTPKDNECQGLLDFYA